MYIERNAPKGKIWIPINIHITHERLQIFFTKFVGWLDLHLKKPWALFLPIKGSKLITDPYGFISVDDLSPEDLVLLDPTRCPYVYQIPTDPSTRKVSQMDDEWIKFLKAEYETQLKENCVFSHGDNVIFRETVYKNLRGIFQYHPDPENPTYSAVALNMFSSQFIITLPSRYLEKYDLTGDNNNTVNSLDMFFTSSVLTESSEEEALD